MLRSLFGKSKTGKDRGDSFQLVAEAIRGLLPDDLKQTTLTSATRLQELGFNSIQYINLVFQLEGLSNKGLEEIAGEMDLSELQTVGDIVELVERLNRA